MYIRWLETLAMGDVPLVGGKNASLGEMICALTKEGISVPAGFATTAIAYTDFLDRNHLQEKIEEELGAWKKGEQTLKQTGRNIRRSIVRGNFSAEFEEQIGVAYRELSQRSGIGQLDVAVRSSATAEDMPDASFAGQQETFLNVRGEKGVLDACRKCYSSLFTDRAISYRAAKGYDNKPIALSVGIQRMVRSDKGGAGVLFTLDMESGFRKVITINASWGLGENVVQGTVTPDEYIVFKPFLERSQCQPILEKVLGGKEWKMVYRWRKGTKNRATSQAERRKFVLSDAEILTLARAAVSIEKHYRQPMDVEWAKDGESGQIFIVQARPETVWSQKSLSSYKTYTLRERGPPLLEGLAIGEAIAAAPAQVILTPDAMDTFREGSILITRMTSPDWVPIMKKAVGIITDEGGRTSHAAIVSRELGVPAIVGTHRATDLLRSGQPITLSCVEGGKGIVYAGILSFTVEEMNLQTLPELKTEIFINISSPAEAFHWWHLPCQGIGLARMEFIINNIIKIHPMALVFPEKVRDPRVRRQIDALTAGYLEKGDYFVDHLARAIAKIGASKYPLPVIVRLSDFKTNEYANLIGGSDFEPKEENPMLGWRGASRYYSPNYRPGFDLECRALKRVRDELGFTNVLLMIPFCRTLQEADLVLKVLAANGLERGVNGLQIYMMAEIPSNILLASDFASRFDGFSIGSNDLTQLVLGIDRDSAPLSTLFDERNSAVKKMIRMLIQDAHSKQCKVGICGQAPSDYPDFASFLIDEGIDSISLNPDSVLRTYLSIKPREIEVPRAQETRRNF